MSPLFRPRHNTLARLSLLLLVAGGATGVNGGILLYVRSPLARGTQDPIEQPVQFDHRHHTRDEGIDCRYCHNTVDRCRGRSRRPALHELPRSSGTRARSSSPASSFISTPIEWSRVYKLPDFVYFNHSTHVTRASVA